MADFPRDRYCPDAFVSAFESSTAITNADPPYYSFAIGDEIIEVHFPERFMEDLTPEDLSLARSALQNVRAMDNLVQETCERNFNRSEYDASQFLFRIAYFEIRGGGAAIRYWGTAVNTEWEATFAPTATGVWRPIGNWR